MRHVVVDANTIVHGAWWLDSAPWRILLYQASHGRIRLVVPEVVLREVVGRYRAALLDASNKRLRATKDLGRLTRSRIDDQHPTQLNRLVDLYEQHLRATLTLASVEMPGPPDDLDILAIADRAIARRAPFNQQGNGFRDTLLWEHVRRLAPKDEWASRGTVTLISQDQAAFYDSDGTTLAPDLVEDLALDGVQQPEAVQIVASVAAFITETGIENPALSAEIADLIRSEQAQISENIAVAIEDSEVDTYSANVRARVSHVQRPARIYLARALVADDGSEVYLDLDVEMDIEIDVEEIGVDGSRATWTASRTVGASADATYDPEHKVIDHLSVGGVSIDADDLTDWLD